MKPVSSKDGGWVIEKGKTKVTIYNATDRYPFLPLRLVYEGTAYKVRKYTLLTLMAKFKNAYSEEQVLEVIMDAIE